MSTQSIMAIVPIMAMVAIMGVVCGTCKRSLCFKSESRGAVPCVVRPVTNSPTVARIGTALERWESRRRWQRGADGNHRGYIRPHRGLGHHQDVETTRYSPPVNASFLVIFALPVTNIQQKNE